MTAFGRAWELLKQERPKEKPPACIFCGNPHTEWRKDNVMDVQHRLGMSDVPPVYGVWCKNWYADPEKGEDVGCEKFFIPDSWDNMLVNEAWKRAFPDFHGTSSFEEDNT
jgi:hypothetical protein